MVFAILFLAIVAIPLRGGQRWACGAVLIAYLCYTLTFGVHDRSLVGAILARSLVGVIVLPMLLAVQMPALAPAQ